MVTVMMVVVRMGMMPGDDHQVVPRISESISAGIVTDVLLSG